MALAFLSAPVTQGPGLSLAPPVTLAAADVPEVVANLATRADSSASSSTALVASLGAAVVAWAATRRTVGPSAKASRDSKGTAVTLQAFENELGVQAPVGFWDPAGFTKDGDVDDFNRRRCSELKHGRIAMLATMGYITPEITGKFPGYISPSLDLKFADIPNGLGAITKVPAEGWAQMACYAAFCELTKDQRAGTPGAAGDLGFKVLSSSDPEGKTRKLNAELANGRLAMMAIIGMFFQDGLTGSAWGDWALYTASPLR